MSQSSAGNRESLQARVEQLVAEAKKEAAARNDAGALDCYQRAATLMAGAPWLQQRTAELARKLKQLELAVEHYRRAAAAFIAAGFPKRAILPLKTAWQASLATLPGDATLFVTLTLELGHVQRELGLGIDAELLIANANRALETSGSGERVPGARDSEPPRSGVTRAAHGEHPEPHSPPTT